MATTKYIRNNNVSSVALIAKVSTGGIKKKFHTHALSMAEMSTGKISKSIARIDTASKSKRAITLYPRNPAKKYEDIEMIRISDMLIRYCLN